MQSEQPQRIETIPLSIRHVAVILVSVVVVLFAAKVLLIPIDNHHHDHTPRPEHRVRMISQALIVYSANHEDRFPDRDQWKSELIKYELIEPPLAVSTASDGTEESYFVVANYNDFSSTDILIYENPKHYTEGVIVGFVDSHVEMIDHDEFELMLANQLAEQDDYP